MARTTTTLCAALLLVALVAGPAGAVPPLHDTLVINNVVQDNGDACGFPVRWDITLEAMRTRFFDQDGNLTHVDLIVEEDNTITNLDTGLTLREGPDHFIQRTFIEEDGVRIETAGLSVFVQDGADSVMDAGRFVISQGAGGIVVLHDAGQHEPRQLFAEGGTLADALAAFCGVLS